MSDSSVEMSSVEMFCDQCGVSKHEPAGKSCPERLGFFAITEGVTALVYVCSDRCKGLRIAALQASYPNWVLTPLAKRRPDLDARK